MASNKHNATKMNNRYVYGSLTRISDLEATPSTWAVHPLKRDEWETGDFVVGKFVTNTCSASDWVELTNGRHARLMRGDMLVGALGVRRATLESVGDWQSIGPDGRMEDLTRAGLFGRETNHSVRIPPHPSFIYQGHVIRNGRKVHMQDFCPKNVTEAPYNCPTILIIGTSMSVGKTCAARVIIRLLKEMGVRRVVGTKLTGAGCYDDMLSFHDAGADAVFDFVDAGLPSSAVPLEEYKQSLRLLLSMVSAQNPDIVVAEAGASPFEVYNGATALQAVANQARFLVLCANDPYAVLGASQSLDMKPDMISGVATSTSAGIELVEQLAGVPALSLCTDESVNELRKMLRVVLMREKILFVP